MRPNRLDGHPSTRIAAAELGRLSLAEALAVTLVFLPGDRERYERACVRWHARWCLEVRPRPDEAGLALAALRALPGPARDAGGEALVELLESRGLDDAARMLGGWLGGR